MNNDSTVTYSPGIVLVQNKGPVVIFYIWEYMGCGLAHAIKLMRNVFFSPSTTRQAKQGEYCHSRNYTVPQLKCRWFQDFLLHYERAVLGCPPMPFSLISQGLSSLQKRLVTGTFRVLPLKRCRWRFIANGQTNDLKRVPGGARIVADVAISEMRRRDRILKFPFFERLNNNGLGTNSAGFSMQEGMHFLYIGARVSIRFHTGNDLIGLSWRSGQDRNLTVRRGKLDWQLTNLFGQHERLRRTLTTGCQHQQE